MSVEVRRSGSGGRSGAPPSRAAARSGTPPSGVRAAARRRSATDLPPQAYFVVSAVFHYLGPAFAVLLFARVGPLGVAWLRIVAAGVVFAAWRRPWRSVRALAGSGRKLLLAWALVLALMNCCFYEAIDRLPL